MSQQTSEYQRALQMASKMRELRDERDFFEKLFMSGIAGNGPDVREALDHLEAVERSIRKLRLEMRMAAQRGVGEA